MKRALIMYAPGAHRCYLDMAAQLSHFFPNDQIIAVAEMADDTTRRSWDAMCALNPNVTFRVLGLPLGKGAAIRAALNLCSADLIALIDPDGIIDRQSIVDYFHHLETDDSIEGIIGNRWSRHSAVRVSGKRKLTSLAFAAAARALFGLRAHDPQAPLKVFRREAMRRIFEDLRLHDRGFDVEVLFQCARHGLRIIERPLNWKAMPTHWPVAVTALRVFAALFYLRILNSPLRRLPFVDFLGRPYNVPVKRSYSIAIFCWRDPKNPDAGGAEVYLQEQAKCWVAQGHHITWFAQRFRGSARDEVVDGIKVVRRGAFPWLFLLAPIWYLFESDKSFDFIIDCMNGIPFFTPLYSTKPKVCLVHHVHSHHFKSELPAPIAALACAVETRLAPVVYRNTRFISVSESSKADIEAHGIARLPVDLIYNGVSSALVPAIKNLHPTVLYLGRLKKYKRISKLIDAFAFVRKRVPEAELIIAGSGDDEADLRAHASALGVQGVRFTGRVDEETKVRLMQQAWVFGMPSSIEGWGIVVIEANACATPAVGYSVGGLRDCVLDGKTGLLADDDAGFREKLLRLLTDAPMLAAMSEAAYQWSNRFSWASSAQSTLEQIRKAQPWHAVFEPDTTDARTWRFVKTHTGERSQSGEPRVLATFE
ncbi:MAG TPA: glycosyltransferase [Candidatus Baltobacteraceae bacterium]|nr:glycosyltransferase [Candidatus Baltobacteraceae bacterium]